LDTAQFPNTAIDMDKPPSLQMVKVTNRNGFVMKDRFDGVPYTFVTNEPLSIPPQAAYHFFGWPGDREVMLRHCCMRWGWNTMSHIQPADLDPKSTRTVADSYFDNIKIETVHFDIVQRAPGAPVPADDGADDTMTDGGAPRSQVEEYSPSGTHAGRGPRGRPRKIEV
jgi:hypothetical protein